MDFQKTETEEGTILSDGGIVPVAKYQCANVVLRINASGDKPPADIVFRVMFSDANFDARKTDGDRKRIRQSETYRKLVCFQSSFPIEDIRCE